MAVFRYCMKLFNKFGSICHACSKTRNCWYYHQSKGCAWNEIYLSQHLVLPQVPLKKFAP